MQAVSPRRVVKPPIAKAKQPASPFYILQIVAAREESEAL